MLPALSTTSTLLAGSLATQSGVSTPEGAESPVPGGFAALLARGTGELAQPAPTAPEPASALPAATFATVIDPASLPASGKTLPAGLPLAAGNTATGLALELPGTDDEGEEAEAPDAAIPTGEVPLPVFAPVSLPLPPAPPVPPEAAEPAPRTGVSRPDAPMPVVVPPVALASAAPQTGDTPAEAQRAPVLSMPVQPAPAAPAPLAAAPVAARIAALVAPKPAVRRAEVPAAPLVQATATTLKVAAAPLATPAPTGLAVERPAAEPAVAAPATGEPRAASAVSLTAEPIAAELQPMLAAREAQPLLTLTSLSAQPAPAATPVAAPTSATQPHDFAALVDRLVEARDALAPQAVTAAIAHADFGHVALRIRHEDGGLAVSLASADPAFAPAVQAAVSASQPGASADNGANPSRQDAQQQAASQSQSQGAGQSAGHGLSQGQPRTRDEARRDGASDTPSRHPGPDEAARDTPDNSGIYA